MTTASQTPARAATLTVAAAAAALALLLFAVYLPLGRAGFISIDDPIYVTENPAVAGGLTAEGIRYAFFASRGGLWMPLTFVSHMIDVSLFGLDPSGPHVENVVWHAANALLLLLLLVRATGRVAPSVVVAALFALHPLRVESVAWVAERKDVLSVFFGLLALNACVSHARRPTFGSYLVILACTVLALLSKPMLVTLPALMLLLDVWPLRRLDGGAGLPRATVRDLLFEKAPLFLLAGAASGITLVTMHRSSGLVALGETSLAARVAHATVSYVWYAWKTVWPTRLAMFYPYPTWAAWQVVGSALVAVLALVIAVAAWRRARWIAVGLAWWVVSLFPVCGVFQNGSQGMADRFTYVPSIGLLVVVVWTLDALARTPRARAALGGAAVVATAALALASARQVEWWHDGRTLYERTLAVTTDNWMIEGELGNRLLADGEPQRAYEHFDRALEIEPRFAQAALAMGVAAKELGRPDEAAARYRDALKIDPTFWKADTHLGMLLFAAHRTDEGLHHLSEAVRKAPDVPETVLTLRGALKQLGVGDVDGYVERLESWALAVQTDRVRPGGATYGAGLMSALLGPRVDAVRSCFANASPTPFNLYVAIAADGALTDVTAVPPTPVGDCFGDELRTARVPAPPFAPFHGQMEMRFGS
jgi:tetratricopeptide (TPR) repeat protein